MAGGAEEMGGSEFEIGKNRSKRGGRSFSLKFFGARGGSENRRQFLRE